MGNDKHQEKLVVEIPIDSVTLEGNLIIPHGAEGIVLFVHGSGSSRHSPRNKFVASQLRKDGLATLLFDLLSTEEEEIDKKSRELRFNIDFLSDRVVAATEWILQHPEAGDLQIGYFGASTGAAAALTAASQQPDVVSAIVSRGGRPDLAETILPLVNAPTLLIVGEKDEAVIEMNRTALEALETEKKMEILAGASHLFEEPGALEKVAKLAGRWFRRYLSSGFDMME